MLPLIGLPFFTGLLFLYKTQRARLFPWALFFIFLLIGWIRAIDAHNTYPEFRESIPVYFSGKVVGLPKKSGNQILVHIQLNWILPDTSLSAKGQKILLKIREGRQFPFMMDTITGVGMVRSIPSAKNPNTINFKKYYASQLVYYELSSRADKISIHPFRRFHIMHFADGLSRNIRKRIKLIFSDQQTAAMVQAVLTGNKNALSPEVKETFSSTGAAHILAVSGLHVGILYAILASLIGSPGRGTEGQRIARCTLMISMIWLYALLTGLSPSVQRAACMLSVYLAGRGSGRTTSPLNVLGFVLCLMVFIQPVIIYQVGFQFSFAAVTGILLFYRSVKNCITVKQKWLEKAWAMSAVTISAQVFIVPLSIYYFNQFPATFLLSSLIAIPASAILISGALFLIPVSWIFPKIAVLGGNLLSFFYSGLYSCLSGLKEFQPEKWSTLFLDFNQVLISCAAILFLVIYLENKKWLPFLVSGMLLLILLIDIQADRASASNKQQLTVYHQYNNLVFSIQSGREMDFFCNQPDRKMNTYLIQPQVTAGRIKNTAIHLPGAGRNKKQCFLLVGGHLFWGTKHVILADPNRPLSRVLNREFPADLVIISKINKGLLENLEYNEHTRIVLCASLPPWDKKLIIKWCKEKELSFHDISSEGAFSLAIT